MSRSNDFSVTATTRIVTVLIIGLLVGGATALLGHHRYAPLVGWDALALVYILWIFATVFRYSASDTKRHAVRENPGRAAGDLLVIVGSIASLGAVGLLVIQAASATGTAKIIAIALGLLSVIASWALVHTSFMLRYARLYYGDTEGGIDFNDQDSPKYSDFAYLAFTIGMTFQVSDTNLKTKEIRATALRHALLSYLFGTVIIATTINTLASLSK